MGDKVEDRVWCQLKIEELVSDPYLITRRTQPTPVPSSVPEKSLCAPSPLLPEAAPPAARGARLCWLVNAGAHIRCPCWSSSVPTQPRLEVTKSSALTVLALPLVHLLCRQLLAWTLNSTASCRTVNLDKYPMDSVPRFPHLHSGRQCSHPSDCAATRIA